MPNEFKMIKLVRANHVAQAIFFRIILKLFPKTACGFSSSNQYSQDVAIRQSQIEVYNTNGFF